MVISKQNQFGSVNLKGKKPILYVTKKNQMKVCISVWVWYKPNWTKLNSFVFLLLAIFYEPWMRRYHEQIIWFLLLPFLFQHGHTSTSELLIHKTCYKNLAYPQYDDKHQFQTICRRIHFFFSTNFLYQENIVC